MRISYTHESIRLTGRWDVSDPRYAQTTNTGSYIEFSFSGRMALAIFDIEGNNADPRLHLWIEVDGGARVESVIDRYLRIMTPDDGVHVCRIIFKSSTEVHRRWYAPLQNKISFVGIDTETPVALPADERKTIEFVGDSITEGVLIDVDFASGSDNLFPADAYNRVYQDDICATYAWLTAEALNLRPIMMGYGAVGVTRSGQGQVPPAPIAYPYHFDGSPISRPEPNFVLINHGANDRRKTPEEYLAAYGELLDTVRALNPNAKIISLSAFCGAHHEELGKFIAEYNQEKGDGVLFIDSNGWIEPEPLHPLRDGHKKISEHLTELLRDLVK
ncbi:MAG: hypothetical protein J6Q82_03050 [Clostridia bacterium]|nr:hypothetical protein [Clostridia bacterium]